MKEYIKTDVGVGELGIYRVLSSAALQAYNESFSTLALPQATAIDTEQQTLTLPYYEGRTFDDVWDVSNGGSLMGLSLVTEIPLVMKDLAKIDPTHITQDPDLAEIPHITYDHGTALRYFDDLASTIHEAGDLTNDDLERIKALLSFEQTTDMIVNNGDFYPRNFIKRPDGKVVLIDWETWNSHSPFFVIDHPENVAAVPYVHMWGNSEWQNAYRAGLNEHFSFTNESFAKGVVMKALALASFFPEHEELFQGQIRTIKSAVQIRH